MASVTKPPDNEVKLSADKDRFILIALDKIDAAGGQAWMRPSKSPKGARQARILDLAFNPLLAIPYEDFDKMMENHLLNVEEHAGLAGVRYSINKTKTVKAS
jgi:hypothetical protein